VRIWEYFREARDKRKELAKDIGQIRQILKRGAEKARVKAAPTLDLARRRVGLVY
jgi:tryptophanyl-tRNA synthetase